MASPAASSHGVVESKDENKGDVGGDEYDPNDMSYDDVGGDEYDPN